MHAKTSAKNSPESAHAPAWTEPWTNNDPHARKLLKYLFGAQEPVQNREIRDTLIQLSVGARPTAELPNRSGVYPTNQVRDISLMMLGVKKEAPPDVLCALAYSGLLNNPKEIQYSTVKRALDTLTDLRQQPALRLAYALTHFATENDKMLGIDVLESAKATRLFFQRSYELTLVGGLQPLFRNQLIENVNAMITPRSFSAVPKFDNDWRGQVLPDRAAFIAHESGIEHPPLQFQNEAADIVCVVEGKDKKLTKEALERLLDSKLELAMVAAAASAARRNPIGPGHDLLIAHAPVFSEALGLISGKSHAAEHFNRAQKPSGPRSDHPA